MIEMLFLTGILSGIASMEEARNMEQQALYRALLDAHDMALSRVSSIQISLEGNQSVLKRMESILEQPSSDEALGRLMVDNLSMRIEGMKLQLALESLDVRRIEANLARLRHGHEPRWDDELRLERLELRQELRALRRKTYALMNKTEQVMNVYGPGSRHHRELLMRSIDTNTAIVQTARRLSELEGLPVIEGALPPPARFAGMTGRLL